MMTKSIAKNPRSFVVVETKRGELLRLLLQSAPQLGTKLRILRAGQRSTNSGPRDEVLAGSKRQPIKTNNRVPIAHLSLELTRFGSSGGV
jgi:hypothetical protein